MDCLRCHRDQTQLQLLKANGQIQFAFHQDCFSCSQCGLVQENQDKCFVSQDNLLYCKPCYHAKMDFCHMCDKRFFQGEMAFFMDDVKIHLECLACSTCQKVLSKGENVKLVKENKEIFCQEHSGITEESSEEESEEKSKKRTPRTKFTEKQTALMMNVFAQTPRPTRLMREQMAKETGLPIRCIQIWFQNKRSKEKRQHSKRFMHQNHWYPQYHQTALPAYSEPEHQYPSPPPSDCDFYNPQVPQANFQLPVQSFPSPPGCF